MATLSDVQKSIKLVKNLWREVVGSDNDVCRGAVFEQMQVRDGQLQWSLKSLLTQGHMVLYTSTNVIKADILTYSAVTTYFMLKSMCNSCTHLKNMNRKHLKQTKNRGARWKSLVSQLWSIATSGKRFSLYVYKHRQVMQFTVNLYNLTCRSLVLLYTIIFRSLWTCVNFAS